MLVLDIEWLLGVCFAARSPADSAPEWPPQPDRVFSALTASWAARGGQSDERAALEWLERQPPPSLAAAPAYARSTVTAYVPTNDPAVTDIRILPERRSRQPRQFPAVTLQGEQGKPHLRLTWRVSPDTDCLASLQVLANDTSFIGHSSSLVRCAFLDEAPSPVDGLRPATTLAAPYGGRLRELGLLYARHTKNADETARPRPALLAEPLSSRLSEAQRSVFGERWIVFECTEGNRPDLRGTAVIARAMRGALMSAWVGQQPEWLSGHAADGSPSCRPHVAIVPLANVGFEHSEQARVSWHGLALVLPREIEGVWLGGETPAAYANAARLRAAFNRLIDPEKDAIALTLGRLGKVYLCEVYPTAVSRKSLCPGRYCASSKTWSTVTPIALDRHTKSDNPREEMAEIIADSCRRIDLPGPTRVHVHKHAAITGAPSAWPPGGAPEWTAWARPGPLAGRQLTHATLHFAEPVGGPLILGAGRFFGLGLCLPAAPGERT